MIIIIMKEHLILDAYLRTFRRGFETRKSGV